MSWFIALTFITHLGHSGHAELNARFDDKAECETFMFMVTSIYQARFKEVRLECRRVGEKDA